MVLIINLPSSTLAATTEFNVLNFGAKPNGLTDTSKAFVSAWEAACETNGPTSIVVPKGRYLLHPVQLSGVGCKSGGITFYIDGTIVAPLDYRVLGGVDRWVGFDRVDGVTIAGRGFFDAKGASLWDCKKGKNGDKCPLGATTLTFTSSNNIVIKGITSLNSQLYHIVINVCKNVLIEDVKIRAAGNSPNTDGIHVQVSSEVTIINTNVKTGDDCVSIGPGTKNLWIERITCGPSHGIRSFDAPNGWCARSSQGQNPYNLSANPCGSSSGSAIAVAANLAAATLGTETDASILCPSSANSVVGIKPTLGLTSRSGVIPVSPTQDTVGPICRTVEDAAYVLDSIVGYDPYDCQATMNARKYIPQGGYAQFLKLDGLKGKRLGIKNELIVMLAEFKLSLNSYLGQLIKSPVRSLADVIAFNNKSAEKEMMKEYGQQVFVSAEATTGFGLREEKALATLAEWSKDGFEKIMSEDELDAIVTPDWSFSSVLAIGGYPGISVPAGYDKDGVPFGICFGGIKGTEPKLIEIAYAFEQATQIRKLPTL
ncbi:hypothetical protein SOVF_053140 [Spinacia oleracea]|nr:hypothetical protein SOVF_053140 [Spinacia oleracea]